MDVQRIERWARAHHGLITVDAAARAGVSRSGWYRALASGVIEQLHPKVARLRGAADTAEQRIAAAVFAGGVGAVASHRSAAHLWGMRRPTTDPIDITLPRGRRVIMLKGVVVHRPTDRFDSRPTHRGGIAVTNPLRTISDLAAVDPRATSSAVEFLIVSGLVGPSALRDLVRRHSRPGRTGAVALREAVEAWPLGDKPADSVLEAAMARLLSTHGLPAAEFHARIEGFEVDFWLIGTPVVIECDGWEYHGLDRVTFTKDRERDAALTAAGYVVMRVTWEHVTRSAAATARRIEAVLRRWAVDPPDLHKRPT